MKTKTKRIFSVLLALAMVLTALPLTVLPAAAATSGDFMYAVLSETDKTCEITDYTGSATELAIPSELDGYTVTSIGFQAFYKCTSLTSVTIPNGVTEIGESAFYGCASLTSITIPNSVTSIGGIGGDTFVGCTTLVEIYVDAGNPNYASKNGVLFDKEKTELICYPAGKQDSSYVIPDSVTEIDKYAFKNCTALTSITIPNSVTEIGRQAFEDCTALTSITIPDSVTEIGRQAFEDCTALTSITIPDSVTEIALYTFENCTALTSITIPDSVTSIGPSAFRNCTALTSIAIPDSVTEIDAYAFLNTAYYNDASNWENDVLYIGNHLVEAETTLSGEYTVKAGTKTIADYAFENCTALTSVILGNGVTSIGDSAFYYCTSLASITIPDSVTEIGEYAFFCCSSLTSVTLPHSVTSIGYGAFQYCTSLTSITIPNGVTSISSSAFSNCTALASVTLGIGVASIGNSAFENCTSLTSITIPDSVTYISSSAFADSGLTTIYGYADSYAETFASEKGYTFVTLQKLTDTNTGVSVGEGSFGNFAENTALNVKKVFETSSAVSYNITLTVNNAVVQPTSEVTVKIPVPETMDGAQCKVYRHETDGTYTDMHAIYRDGYMVFTTDHFSTYALTPGDPDAILTYTPGDVNGDEKVNAVDARWVLQAASGARTFDATQTAAADVNGDGKINAVDARWILQAASGARVL